MLNAPTNLQNGMISLSKFKTNDIIMFTTQHTDKVFQISNSLLTVELFVWFVVKRNFFLRGLTILTSIKLKIFSIHIRLLLSAKLWCLATLAAQVKQNKITFLKVPQRKHQIQTTRNVTLSNLEQLAQPQAALTAKPNKTGIQIQRFTSLQHQKIQTTGTAQHRLFSQNHQFKF